jgi:hypothetical protein
VFLRFCHGGSSAIGGWATVLRSEAECWREAA